MRPRELALAFALALGTPVAALASDVAAPAAPPAGAITPGAPLPPGHPSLGAPSDGAGDGDELPPGHPPTSGRKPPPGPMDQPPEDASNVDRALPAGTIAVEIRDADDKPVPGVDITLGILQQSVAKGDSRRHVAAKADDGGNARFDGLETGSGVAYRVTVPWSSPGASAGATYAAPPFQLDLAAGQRVRVHVYPVSSRIEDVLVGMQGIAYVEVKDDVLQIEEAFTVFNIGKKTWVPNDVVIDLPAGFKAFNAPKQMTDVGFDQVEGRGARLRGTFSPGQHELGFRFQVPWSGDASVALPLGLPPHVARMRVITEATRGMQLHVDGFPAAESARNANGQRVLYTERQLRPGDGQLTAVRVVLDDLPSQGPGRWIALGLALVGLGAGLWIALDRSRSAPSSGGGSTDADRARERILEELRLLERARDGGEIGPRTYERVRRLLIDALARLLPDAAKG